MSSVITSYSIHYTKLYDYDDNAVGSARVVNAGNRTSYNFV